MSSINNIVEKFCLENSTKTDDVLNYIYRDTWVNVLYPQMLTNELQAKFMKMISEIKKPTKILEIGTFTGYATISMSTGLHDDGKIITIEKNEELKNIILKNFDLAKISNKVELIIGDAKLVLQHELKTQIDKFDLVYIDADKENYPLYLKLVYRLMKKGGILLADNVFWGGKMIETNYKKTKESIGISTFLSDAKSFHWQGYSIIPIGDGLFFAIKP